jgi:hypothetical protein
MTHTLAPPLFRSLAQLTLQQSMARLSSFSRFIWPACGWGGGTGAGLRPNNSFKPNPLRGFGNTAGSVASAFCNCRGSGSA